MLSAVGTHNPLQVRSLPMRICASINYAAEMELVSKGNTGWRSPAPVRPNEGTCKGYHQRNVFYFQIRNIKYYVKWRFMLKKIALTPFTVVHRGT